QLLLVLSLAPDPKNFAHSPSPVPRTEPDVVKISTNLIQIDATVVDSKHRIVSDLRPEEIEIYENGKKQNITNFSFISSVTFKTEKPAADKNAMPVPPPTVRPGQTRRTLALVVDDLSLS